MDHLDELIGLGVVISLKDAFSETKNRITERMGELEEKAAGTAEHVSRSMTLLKVGLAAALAGGLVFASKAVEETLKVKGLRDSVTALAGDTGQLSEALDRVARRSGVFQGEDLQAAGKQLEGMGLAVAKIPAVLDAAAKRAAVLGGSIDESAHAFIGMRLAMESGMAPTRALKALGLSLGDLAAQGIRTSKNKVLSSMDDVMDATVRALNAKFGARAQQIAGGVRAMKVQIGEAMQDIFVSAGEAGLVDAEKTLLGGVLEVMRSLADSGVGQAIGRGIRSVFDALAPLGHALKIVALGIIALFSSSEGGIGSIPGKLHDELVAKGLWPLVSQIFTWGERVKALVSGAVEGMRAGFAIASKVLSPLVSVLRFALSIVGAVGRAISSLFGKVGGAKEASEQLRGFGVALGGVAAAWLSLRAASVAWSVASGAVKSVVTLAKSLTGGGKSLGEKLKEAAGGGMPVKVTNWPSGGIFGVPRPGGGGETAEKAGEAAALGWGRRALSWAGTAATGLIARVSPKLAALLASSVASLASGGVVSALLTVALPLALAALAGVALGALLDALGVDDWIARKLGPNLDDVTKDADAKYKEEFDEQRRKRAEYIAGLEQQGMSHRGAVLAADQESRRAAGSATPIGGGERGGAAAGREDYRARLQTVIHNHIHLDGKKIHESVVEHENATKERTYGAVG